MTRDIFAQYKKGVYLLTVMKDEDPQNPRREWANLGTMVCFHNKYDLGDKKDLPESTCDSWHEWETYLEKEKKAVITLPLYLYDHSGITIRTTPFGDHWDSAQVGFIYVTKDDIRKWYGMKDADKLDNKMLMKVRTALIAEVETYDSYLTGDVYCFTLEDDDENLIDSCSGFYGDDHQEGMKEHLEVQYRDIFNYPYNPNKGD